MKLVPHVAPNSEGTWIKLEIREDPAVREPFIDLWRWYEKFVPEGQHIVRVTSDMRYAGKRGNWEPGIWD